MRGVRAWLARLVVRLLIPFALVIAQTFLVVELLVLMPFLFLVALTVGTTMGLTVGADPLGPRASRLCGILADLVDAADDLSKRWSRS